MHFVKLEGGAVFCYANADSFEDGERLVEAPRGLLPRPDRIAAASCQESRVAESGGRSVAEPAEAPYSGMPGSGLLLFQMSRAIAQLSSGCRW